MNSQETDQFFSGFIRYIRDDFDGENAYTFSRSDLPATVTNANTIYKMFNLKLGVGQNGNTVLQKHIQNIINSNQNEFVIDMNNIKCSKNFSDDPLRCKFCYDVKFTDQISPSRKKFIKKLFGSHIKNGQVIDKIFTVEFVRWTGEFNKFSKLGGVSYYENKQEFSANLANVIGKTFGMPNIKVSAQCDMYKGQCEFTVENPDAETIDSTLPIKTMTSTSVETNVKIPEEDVAINTSISVETNIEVPVTDIDNKIVRTLPIDNTINVNESNVNNINNEIVNKITLKVPDESNVKDSDKVTDNNNKIDGTNKFSKGFLAGLGTSALIGFFFNK